jgi:hypothetical protein
MDSSMELSEFMGNLLWGVVVALSVTWTLEAVLLTLRYRSSVREQRAPGID